MIRRAIAALSLSTTMAATSAFADWEVFGTPTDVDTTESGAISFQLPMLFPSALQFVSAIDLTSKDKLVVTSLKGSVTTYRWHDDDACTAPTLPADQSVTNVQILFTAGTAHGGISMSEGLLIPCSSKGGKLKTSNVRMQ